MSSTHRILCVAILASWGLFQLVNTTYIPIYRSAPSLNTPHTDITSRHLDGRVKAVSFPGSSGDPSLHTDLQAYSLPVPVTSGSTPAILSNRGTTQSTEGNTYEMTKNRQIPSRQTRSGLTNLFKRTDSYKSAFTTAHDIHVMGLGSEQLRLKVLQTHSWLLDETAKLNALEAKDSDKLTLYDKAEITRLKKLLPEIKETARGLPQKVEDQIASNNEGATKGSKMKKGLTDNSLARVKLDKAIAELKPVHKTLQPGQDSDFDAALEHFRGLKAP